MEFGIDLAHFFAANPAFIFYAHLRSTALNKAFATVHWVFGQICADLIDIDTNGFVVGTRDRTLTIGTSLPLIAGMAAFTAVILIGKQVCAGTPAGDLTFDVARSFIGHA